MGLMVYFAFSFLVLLVTVDCKLSLNPFSKVIQNRRGFYQGYPDYTELPPAPVAFKKKIPPETNNINSPSNSLERMDLQQSPMSASNYLFYNQRWNPGPAAILAPVFAPISPFDAFKQTEHFIHRKWDSQFAPYGGDLWSQIADELDLFG